MKGLCLDIDFFPPRLVRIKSGNQMARIDRHYIWKARILIKK